MTVQMFPPPTACSRGTCAWACGGRWELGPVHWRLLQCSCCCYLQQVHKVRFCIYTVHAKACRMTVLNSVAQAVGLPLSALAWCLFDISQWCTVFSKGQRLLVCSCFGCVCRSFTSVALQLFAPLLFKSSVAQLGWSMPPPAAWSLVMATSTILGTICSPLIGAVADRSRSSLCLCMFPFLRLFQCHACMQPSQDLPHRPAPLSHPVQHFVRFCNLLQRVSAPDFHCI
jgi:hypothetical protein